jgi:hypothetical protein
LPLGFKRLKIIYCKNNYSIIIIIIIIIIIEYYFADKET